MLLAPVGAAAAEPSDTAFVFAGESDPSGADDAFLRAGRSRGAKVAREVPGHLEEEPRSRLQKAVEAYARLQLPDARDRLDALETEAAATGGVGLGRGELIELFATRAAVRLAGGGEAAAWDDLLQVATFAPARPLDPARYPPRVLEAERRAAEALTIGGKLAVSVLPVDASVFVDGLVLGRGSVEAVLPTGRHFVRAERAGFTAAGRTIEVGQTGAAASLSLTARPVPSSELLTRSAGLLSASRVVGAWIDTHDGAPVLELSVIDVATGQVRARAQLETARVTSSDLDAVLGRLLPVSATAPRRWFRRPLVWGLVGGVVAAAALSVGLGVGLSPGRVGGWSAHVDLQGAR